MPWFEGSTLLYTLENIHIGSDHNHIDCRFPVQTVIRPKNDKYHDYRGYAGRIAGGVFKPGDKVVALPSGFSSTIKSIDTFEQLYRQFYRDEFDVYWWGNRLPLNINNLKLLKGSYIADDEHVYYGSKKIAGADVATFKVTGDYHAKDLPFSH